MYKIAIHMLFGDKGKYIGMVIGIAFAALIMSQQPAIFIGLMSRTFSFIKDVNAPHIWVMDPGVQFVEEHKPIRDIELYRVRGVDGVKWAVPLYKNLMAAKLPDGNSKTIDVTGLDDGTLVGAPYKVIGCSLIDIRKADAVLVDQEAASSRLRVSLGDGQTRALQIGDSLEINDKRALVMGFVKTTRNFVLQPQVYTTYSRAISYSSPNRKTLTYVLVQAQDGVPIDDLCKRIEEKTGLRAYSADEFSWVNLDYWMKSTGIPINFGISVLLGFLVGAAIAGQTFFNFVMENIKYFAALKAMGIKMGTLRNMVLLQASIVGFVGYGLGVGATALFGVQARDSVLAFRMDPELLLFSGCGVLLIVMLAAVIGINRIMRVDPSIVFRT